MRIKNNITAMNVRRNQATNNKRITASLEKLSSGYRINRAADDAAGLAISEKMRAQIAGLDTAVENCKQGINLFKTADGTLGDVSDLLQRMNELCVKAGNETFGPDERAAIQAEIDSLLDEVNRISKSANYNDIPLLSVPAKSSVDVVFIVDTTTNMSTLVGDIKNNLDNYVGQLSDKGLNVRMGLVDYRDVEENRPVFTTSAFTDDVAAFEAQLGSLTFDGGNDPAEAGLEAIMDGAFSMKFDSNSQKVFVLITDSPLHEKGDVIWNDLTPYQYTISEVADKLKDRDVALTVIGSPSANTTTLANLAGGSHINCNSATRGAALVQSATDLAATLSELTYYDLPLQIGDSAEDLEAFRLWEVSPESLKINDVAVDPMEKLYESLDKLKTAINSVSSIRGEYGAYVNRLEHAIDAIGVNLENLSASESTIRDTDMADEMTELTKQNILSQAAQSILSQANATPQGVLKLLQ